MSFWTNLFSDIHPKIAQIQQEMALIKQEMKNLKEDMDKLEIKALESRKIYKKKLQALDREEEKEEDASSPLIFGK